MTETIDEMAPMQIAARKHRDADMLRAGTYGEMNGGFHACSIGCFAYEVAPERFSASAGWIDDEQHRIVAEAYGYPEWLVRLQDTVFEGLPPEVRLDWHVQIADAIAARKRDWTTILHAIHASILRVSYRTAGSASDAVRVVIDLHERAAGGEAIPDAAWSAAWSVAWSAAWGAVESAESAESAERSAARRSARRSAYVEIRDGILAELVRE